jgi:hypothetical protein
MPTGAADPLQFGNATSLTPNGDAAGPFFVTFGVFDADLMGDFELGFSWDPTGNDPYGTFANNFFNYDNPPIQATYTYDATMYLDPTLQAQGFTAAFILNAVPMTTGTPEPASLTLIATGCFGLAAFRGFRPRNRGT